METIDTRRARRLALARAGLLKPKWTGLPERAAGAGKRARSAALATLERFGYLQLDTVSVAGARSHSLVLLSRFEGLQPEVGEGLLQPDAYEAQHAPVFEYWGHEACWIPLELYPAFEFRRKQLRRHKWFGSYLDEHPRLADEILRRAREQGAFRSADLEGSGSGSWWGFKLSKKIATSLWSCGELAIRERRAFQRTFDLPERVIPERVRAERWSLQRSLVALLGKAIDGHGWATTGTLADTWRLRNLRPEITAALQQMQDEGGIVPCELRLGRGLKTVSGWIRPGDLELAERLDRARPSASRAVLLSPFDPVLWDRTRVQQLFGFQQVLEIFKPQAQRVYGYFCMPVLAGEKLVARYDLKAERAQGRLEVRAHHLEDEHPAAAAQSASQIALERHAEALKLAVH